MTTAFAPALPACAGVALHFCSLDDDATITLADAAATLSGAEAERAARLHFPRDRARFMRGRGFMRRVLGAALGLAPDAVPLATGERGKPCLARHPAPGFNLSHAGGLARLTGLDINPTIIARNRETLTDPRLCFAQGDAAGWLAAHPAPRRALLSYGGVMEYFAPATLEALFGTLAAHPPAVVALCEPLDPAHDLAHEPASRAFGQESSYSHNHAHLLRRAGFDVIWHEEVNDGGVRWMMMLAERGADAAAA